jgi:hypothetical protein
MWLTSNQLDLPLLAAFAAVLPAAEQVNLKRNRGVYRREICNERTGYFPDAIPTLSAVPATTEFSVPARGQVLASLPAFSLGFAVSPLCAAF